MHALIPEYTIFTHQNLVDGSANRLFEICPDHCFLFQDFRLPKIALLMCKME